MPVGNETKEVNNIILIATDRDVDSFKEKHAGIIYDGIVRQTTPLTDDLNPVELYVVR
jgi:hypothetical protein